MQSDEVTAVVSRSPRRRPSSSGGQVTLAVAVVVLLLAGVSVLAWPVVFRPAATATGGEVYREATSAPGRDPFSGTVVLGNPPGTKSQTPIDGTAGTVRTIAGDVPALYGGSRNEHVCDRQKLVTFLQENPDKATAWAGVLGINTTDIPTYIATLTPLQLRADTRVTNHGFVDGHATSLQSVLQAGTVVLADDHGRPRVKCGCGNPLLDPVATPITPVYTGDDLARLQPAQRLRGHARRRPGRPVRRLRPPHRRDLLPATRHRRRPRPTHDPTRSDNRAADTHRHRLPIRQPPERYDLRRQRTSPLPGRAGPRRRPVRADPDLVPRREPSLRRRHLLRTGPTRLPRRTTPRRRRHLCSRPFGGRLPAGHAREEHALRQR